MDEILETKQFEFDKSGFLIDLVKHASGKRFVEITQTIHSNESVGGSIKINPSILPEIISVLQNYSDKIPEIIRPDKTYLSESDKKKIVQQYLKGVSSKDLALCFRQSKDLIEMVLRNSGVEIVSNKVPKSRGHRKRGRR